MGEVCLSLFPYSFPLIPITRIHYDNPKLFEFFEREEPVLIEGSDLVRSAVEKWDLDYLTDNLGSRGDYNVMQTEGHQTFMFFDQKKSERLKGQIDFTPQSRVHDMKFPEFVKRSKGEKSKKYYYLQQPLTDSVGPNIYTDFRSFNWGFINHWSLKMKWGPLTNNMLLIGEPGNITPVHFDEQQNLFCQVGGKKRCLLFHPRHFDKLYPYPVYHPCDRQSKVNLRSPDLSLYPLSAQLEGLECVASPGDVLYIPMHWWHQIESVGDSLTTSITFWYKPGSQQPGEVKLPLSAQQKVSMMRNIEKMVHEALKDPREVDEVLCNIVHGRYSKKIS